MVREWLSGGSIGLKDTDILAVELFGQYKEGQQVMIECNNGPTANELVGRVLALAQEQKAKRDPQVFEARKLNLTAAEKQEAASAARYAVRIGGRPTVA